jgi:hypothetical protein
MVPTEKEIRELYLVKDNKDEFIPEFYEDGTIITGIHVI